MVSGIKLHTLLCELSRLLEFEIGETGPDDGAYLPGGAKHVPIKDAGKTTRNDRWNKWLPHMGRAERAIGKQDHSWLMATGVANALCPSGHGQDARKKLGLDPNTFLQVLVWSNDDARERIKQEIAKAERKDNHVGQCLTLKRASNSTFAILDAYRHMFLIKHPSRRDIIGEARRVLAILYSLMGGGVAWESVQNIEAALLRAATQAHLDAEQAAEVEVGVAECGYLWRSTRRGEDKRHPAQVAAAVQIKPPERIPISLAFAPPKGSTSLRLPSPSRFRYRALFIVEPVRARFILCT
jgi:hypothetical protein